MYHVLLLLLSVMRAFFLPFWFFLFESVGFSNTTSTYSNTLKQILAQKLSTLMVFMATSVRHMKSLRYRMFTYAWLLYLHKCRAKPCHLRVLLTSTLYFPPTTTLPETVPPVDPHVEPSTSIVTKHKQGSSFFSQGLKPWYRRHVYTIVVLGT
jgi:hypothetical protein